MSADDSSTHGRHSRTRTNSVPWLRHHDRLGLPVLNPPLLARVGEEAGPALAPLSHCIMLAFPCGINGMCRCVGSSKERRIVMEHLHDVTLWQRRWWRPSRYRL